MCFAVQPKTSCCDVLHAAAARDETAIGHYLHAEAGGRPVLNPPKSDQLRFAEEDRIIVLARD